MVFCHCSENGDAEHVPPPYPVTNQGHPHSTLRTQYCQPIRGEETNTVEMILSLLVHHVKARICGDRKSQTGFQD